MRHRCSHAERKWCKLITTGRRNKRRYQVWNTKWSHFLKHRNELHICNSFCIAHSPLPFINADFVWNLRFYVFELPMQPRLKSHPLHFTTPPSSSSNKKREKLLNDYLCWLAGWLAVAASTKVHTNIVKKNTISAFVCSSTHELNLGNWKRLCLCMFVKIIYKTILKISDTHSHTVRYGCRGHSIFIPNSPIDRYQQ